MIRNDILRRLRYALNLSNKEVITLFSLKNMKVTDDDVVNFLKKEDDAEFEEISDNILETFLDGFIVHKRGEKKGPNVKNEEKNQILNNNVILRKIKIAMTFSEEDLMTIFKLSDFPMSSSEISALFRNKDHRNYKKLGDQGLRNFLEGLAIHLRGR